ncbi:MAG: hypothetical protein JXA13_08540 [Anaerolineales bacterium]|nr:hypothetical protein [Anaerolineales bacterium]
MKYTVKNEMPGVRDSIDIRLWAALSRKSEGAVRIRLSNNIFGTVVYNQDTPIGIERIAGDSGCYFEIVDIASFREHQKKEGEA